MPSRPPSSVFEVTAKIRMIHRQRRAVPIRLETRRAHFAFSPLARFFDLFAQLFTYFEIHLAPRF